MKNPKLEEGGRLELDPGLGRRLSFEQHACVYSCSADAGGGGRIRLVLPPHVHGAR